MILDMNSKVHIPKSFVMHVKFLIVLYTILLFVIVFINGNVMMVHALKQIIYVTVMMNTAIKLDGIQTALMVQMK